MKQIAPALYALLFAGLLPARGLAQWGNVATAALPAAPYWWSPGESAAVDLLPLLWTNDIDGGGSGCCVIGAALRRRVGPAALWLGLGFGSDGEGGAPAAIEGALAVRGGTLVYRDLHGRSGFAAFYPVFRKEDSVVEKRVSLGVSALRLHDPRYIDPVPLFRCPREGPAAPCAEVTVPYPWSAGEDNALALEAAWGTGEWEAPRITGSITAGVRIMGGDHDYLRAELAGQAGGSNRTFDWRARLAGGWVSGGSPLQRRFLLYGADPVTRWINPYIDVKGALFAGIPYYVPGGANLRAYEATQPLVRSYLGALGEIGKAGTTAAGFWGHAGAYLAIALTPGIPDRLGPEELNESGSFLFDWRELPEGEGRELGRFRARVLEVSQLWADAGLALSGGYHMLGVTLSLPLWVSEPAFANEPIGGGEKKAIALRGTLTIRFFTDRRPGM